MKTIHKYNVSPWQHEQSVLMPKGAKIISVQEQYNNVVLWALVETENLHESRTIIVNTTGSEFHPESNKFIGTVQLNDGSFVSHIYEK